MVGKILTVVVVIGALGFFVGSVTENELVYTLSACVATCAGLVKAIQGRKAEN